ncbi:MAG: MBL fold metallo-hydrolase [Gammaproteobacteria bacterium]
MGWSSIGSAGVARVLESNGPFQSIYEFFPDATPELLEPHRGWLHEGALDDNDFLVLPIQSYVVRTPQTTILVDSCVGNHKNVKLFPGWNNKTDDEYMTNFAALGIHPDEIDVVLCTHLHVDHSGWNTRREDGRWVPTFRNARYILSRTEVRHAETMHEKYGDPVFVENVQPVIEAGQALLVDDDHQIDDHAVLEPTPGHTPGHCAVRVDAGGASAVITGDLIHSPIQCHFPHWSYTYDADREQAAATRRAFLERYADCDTRVLTAHFPLPSCGHVVSSGDVFRFDYEDL